MTVNPWDEEPAPDPNPLLRCRCVNGIRPHLPYHQRCMERATEEDGLCDHCRGGIRPLSDEGWRGIGTCFTCPPDASWCCLSPSAERTLVDPATPCAAVREEVPF